MSWRRQCRCPRARRSITSASDRGIRSARADNYLRVPLLEGSAALSVRSAGDVLGAGRRFFVSGRRLLDLSWVTLRPVTGAHLMIGATLQKSLLQSAPWAILAFIMFTLAWLPWFRMPEARRRQIRLLSLVTLAIIAVFAFAGVSRNEGLSFNQRYLLELLPLAAVGFAWALDGLNVRVQPVLHWSLVRVSCSSC